VPVVVNNYTRGDFTEEDYRHVKELNLMMQQWDVPTINVLGAIDDGHGRWAAGYQNGSDAYHPNSIGHQEFALAIPPTLFDALKAGKPLPQRDMNSGGTTLGADDLLLLENTQDVHAFTLSLRLKATSPGLLVWLANRFDGQTTDLSIDPAGHLCYHTAWGDTLRTRGTLTDGGWHTVTIAHYYAQQRTFVYLDNEQLSRQEHLLLGPIAITSPKNAAEPTMLGELFFWRSALNELEVAALVEGKMLRSSLDIYVPFRPNDSGTLENLAQSLNLVNLHRDSPGTLRIR